MPQLLHAGFISPKTKDAILKGLEVLCEPRQERSAFESPAKAEEEKKQQLTDA